MKEEYAIILEYLPNGYPLERKTMPLAQAVGEEKFTLLEIVPRRGMTFEEGERVYIGEGKRDKVYYILGKLSGEKLTEASKNNLQEFIKDVVSKKEKKYVEFFNKAEAINKRIHQIELLPGLGKKHTKEILKQRQEKEFESFEDIRNRIPNIPDPQKAIEKRIFQELTQFERYILLLN